MCIHGIKWDQCHVFTFDTWLWNFFFVFFFFFPFCFQTCFLVFIVSLKLFLITKTFGYPQRFLCMGRLYHYWQLLWSILLLVKQCKWQLHLINVVGMKSNIYKPLCFFFFFFKLVTWLEPTTSSLQWWAPSTVLRTLFKK